MDHAASSYATTGTPPSKGGGTTPTPSPSTLNSSLELAEVRGRVSVSGNDRKPPPELRQELRHRRPSGTSTSSTTTKRKRKKKRRWRWIVGKPRDLTMEQEQVFMTMKLRKLNRALTGTKTKKTRFESIALVAYFVLAFGVVSYTSSEAEEMLEEETGSRRIIVLDLTEIIIIMVYILVVSLVTSVFRESKFITLLYWMFIYLPLAAMIVSFILDDHGDWGNFIGRNPVVAILLITAEMVVLTGFLSLYRIYPKVVQSNWFRRKKRAGTFWRIKVISDWTMTYVGSWGRRFTCKYDGETNEHGLPHGFGRWLDDSYAGEVLTGTWINGIPVAPFASRQFGTGDAFKAVRIGYIMASDDEFSTTRFWPSNDKPPRIGMCSVECSISGSFYNELPLATHLSGPHWLDEEQHTVAKLCRQLTHVDDEEERMHQTVQIKASDPRGVQVRGHVYGATGESFHAGTDMVVVHVDKEVPPEEQAQSTNHHHRKMTPRRSLNFLPRAGREQLNWRPERIIVCDESDRDSGDESDRHLELQTVVEEDSQNMSTSNTNLMRESPVVEAVPLIKRTETPLVSQDSNNSGRTTTSAHYASASTLGSTLGALMKRTETPLISQDSNSGRTTANSVSAHYASASTLGSTLGALMKRKETPLASQDSNNSGRTTANSASASTLGSTLGALMKRTETPFVSQDSNNSVGGSTIGDMELGMSERTTLIAEPFRMANASLRIDNWIPAPHKDALVFFPGYKVPLKNALEALGQFIAMSKLDSRVYPVIFGWPNGQRLTYHPASRMSASETNKENLYELLKGLQAAGIRNVHLMSHSMGVQTMLAAFDDNEDESRSELSQLFQLDPDFVDEEDVSSKESYRTSGSDRSLMICRTVTMLNPDFPLDAFVDRAFQSVRRVCSTVTIIGDRHDKALLMSKFMNGVGVYFGYTQPEVLQPKPNRALDTCSEREVKRGKHRMVQPVIGLSIESLYFPDDLDREFVNDALLFKERAPVVVVSDEEPVADRAWLDVDVIDTTGLDTNIAGIRHSGFNLNPILLKDLEELISTGRRAVNRATLLYREGNLFSYCHAPSYVAM